MVTTDVTAAYAEALFVSSLQRSDNPTPGQVRAAVEATLGRRGEAACGAALAQECGEHPLEAVGRMAWVWEELRRAYPGLVAGAPRRRVA